MSKIKDLRLASRIEEATPARGNADFAWNAHHAGFDWALVLWIGEGFGAHSAFVSSKEKQVFINTLCQPFRVSREVTFQHISNFDALVSSVYSSTHTGWDLHAYIGGRAPSEMWFECKHANEATAKHEVGRFTPKPSSPLTSSEREQLLLLLNKARLSGHKSDQELAYLPTVLRDPHSDEEARHAPPQPQVGPTEEFQGFVEKIEGDRAYVRLDSHNGERLCGPYPAGELTANGIGERDRFLLKAVEVNGAVRFDAVLVPRKKISPERQRQIREEIEAELEGFTPDDER